MTGPLDPATVLDLHDVVQRYAACVDDRDHDGVAALFAAEGVLVVPDPPGRLEPAVEHHGPDGVRSALSVLDQFVRTLHEVTGVVLDPEPDDPRAARGRVTGVAHHYVERDDALVDVQWRLRYDDRYVRLEDGWRIAHRAVTVLAIETARVRQVLGTTGGRGS